MDHQYTSYLSDEERAALRSQRAALRKRKQRARRRKQLKQFLPIAALAVFLVVLLAVWKGREPQEEQTEEPSAPVVAVMPEVAVPEEPEEPYSAEKTADTATLGADYSSSYAVLIDLQKDTIIAERDAQAVINPASMTKVLTLLVAAEQLEHRLDETFTMTIDITDYCFVNGCSVVGLDIGETVTVRELLYGCILPSGADASLGLAMMAAGSHEAFVELMNEKLEELGLADTAHFTNCVGLYDENHHCTVYDMAMILKAAMDNPLCREVLDARTYQTLPNEQNPEGEVLSNWFLRRIEDKDTGEIDVVAGKTGYVVESGNCAASCGEDPEGNRYICVTGDAGSGWQAIYDHVALYKNYCN